MPSSAGIGLKSHHYRDVLAAVDNGTAPGWVEVHPQNYFGAGGPPHRWLTAINDHLPLSLHSVGLSLGSADGLNEHDLEGMARLCERYEVASVSDHISWSGQADDRYPDLLPIPYTQFALDHLASQIDRVQNRLGRQMLVENPSRYLAYDHDEMDEIDFINRLCAMTGCGLLFDINNVEVSATNMKALDGVETMPDPEDYIDRIDPALVGEIHLAGHAREDHDDGPLLIDDHGSPVNDLCWSLYARFIQRAGPKPTLIEWDTDIPEYAVLIAEVQAAQAIMAEKTAPVLETSAS
ncbi:MNIO family bufferin maturase [Alterisphingorhabdus coralli]|uniref:DUF692 domain-containing protein n=1 Tax=Alterisphingorhabdus coralli TaxID=3071408 RepID=A0AA97I2G9_9SPHN|nr:DUF692 domain-containing protein [Parasphingorhabdus sp. SCSIO 66989]WOE76233.1 DUF692 domain-containing protein [Parasphingorhabdus sp. SCSIO 66989]